MTFLKRLFTPPAFDDESKNHQAFLLHVILWTLIFVPIPLVIYTIIATPQYIDRTLTQAAFGETVNIFLLYLLRRGDVRLACQIQISAFWFFITVTAVTDGGVQGEAYLLGYSLVIGIAGILLGGRGAMLFTILSLVAGWFMMNSQLNGKWFPAYSSTPLRTWIISLVLFPVGAVLQYLATHVVRDALARAHASEERYRLISEVISDYTFSTKLNPLGDLQLDWVAGAFENITGYTYDKYISSGGWRAHLHPDDIGKDEQDMTVLKANCSIISEIRTITNSGKLRWVRVYAHPVWDDAQNRLSGIVGAVQDITARKNAEADREALITELENKNAELERYTYTVSHDLKAPLVTITGFLGYLEKDILSGNMPRMQESMARISQAAEKMHALLNDLLELSRVGRLMNPPEIIQFNNVIDEAMRLLDGQIEESKSIIEVEDDLPVIKGDQSRLVEVVQNLVNNAIKFSGVHDVPKIKIGRLGTLNNMPVLYVRDNGIGIEPEYHEKVFGLFNKLNPRSEGTGIGLALVKRIVEVHGGKIWIESEGAGHGCTFCFTLPS